MLRYPEIFSSGLVTVNKDLSGPIKRYTTHSQTLPSSWVTENYNYYKNSDIIKKVDAFICSFPASMCQLWIPFNKTIIFLPAHRYNLGTCIIYDSESEYSKNSFFLFFYRFLVILINF